MVIEIMDRRAKARKIFFDKFQKENPHVLKILYARNPRGGDNGGQEIVKRSLAVDFFVNFKLDNYTNSYNSYIFTNCSKDMANLRSMDFEERGNQGEVKMDVRFRSFILDDKGYRDKIPHSG